MGGTSAEESTYKKKKSFLSKLRRSSRKPRAELVTTPPPKSQQRQPVLETPVKRDPSKNVGNLDFPETLAETPPLTPEERRRSRLEHYGEPTVEPDWKIPVVQQHTEDEDEDQLYMTGEATQEVEDGDLLNVITLEEEGNDVIFDNPSLDNKDKARPPIDSITTSSGVPVITSLGSDSFRPSEVQNFGGLSVVGSYYGTNDSDLMSHDPSQATKKVMRGRTTRKTRQKKILAQAPSARDSAYEGPPRYDWIDIVSFYFMSLFLHAPQNDFSFLCCLLTFILLFLSFAGDGSSCQSTGYFPSESDNEGTRETRHHNCCYAKQKKSNESKKV
uniref:Uncharacterized protein n=1 Tax=Ditylum brightwellii TaxID=49249 RepID=A0A6V2B2W6_9STRA